MEIPRRKPQPWKIVLLGLMSLACLAGLWKVVSTSNLGGADFMAYWSAARLLRLGQNPYDPQLMQETLGSLGTLGSGYMPMAWNPPFLFIFLLPFTLLPYDTARFAWLLTNSLMVLGAALMLIRLYFPKGRGTQKLLFLLMAFTLPQVLVGILIGQVTYLVLLGLVGALALMQKKKWFLAGMFLVLTSIKPHMVVLALLFLLIMMARQRRFSGWAGLASAAVLCIAALFLLRPAWVQDLIGVMGIAPVGWATPTIGGLLSHLGVTEVVRYLIVLLLPLPVLLACRKIEIKPERAVAVLTLVTVPLTFFGWSFDQNLLLLPLAQVFYWVNELKNQNLRLAFGAALGISVVANWCLRFMNLNDIVFLWFPLFCWLLYGAAWWLHRKRRAAIDHPAGAA
jgi:hypothetical protein